MQYWTYQQILDKVQKDLDLQQESFISPSEMMAYCNEAIDSAEAEILNLYEDYFLTNATISLIAGTSQYSLPTNIYASKIRNVVYNNGSDIFEVKRIVNQPNRFVDMAVASQSGVGSDDYRYVLVNSSAADGIKLELYPTPQETTANALKVWYIRNANRITATTDLCDIPEFISYVTQYMKVRCYEKEMHPNLQKSMSDLDAIRNSMINTLSTMVDDGENKIEPDMSFYEESN